jgi:endogenous inhibitor of DNA gyrase (YacG/DUF329 family)
VLEIVPVSELLDKSLQKSTKTQQCLSFRATQTPHRQPPPLFQLTGTQATTAGPRCSESCRSVDCMTNPCKSRRQQQQSRSDKRKQTHIAQRRLIFQLTEPQATTAGPLCSESCQSVDCPTSTCKVDENTARLLFRTTQTTHRQPPPLFQLTGTQATTAGPRCSESCRSVNCWTRACRQNNSNPLFRPTHSAHRTPMFQLTVAEATTARPRCSGSCHSVDCRTNPCKSRQKHSNASRSEQRKHLIANRRLCSNSQVRKRRQLAHGAQNRAGQLNVRQIPAKSRTLKPHHSFST